ncbi:MAG: MotA/TolQ/ExbB proton channel family protein [Pseudomonadota bacterium]
MKKTLNTLLIGCAAALFGLSAAAQEAASPIVVNEANSLDELLRNVEQRRVTEARDHAQRESRFRQDRANQQNLLNRAKDDRRREEQRSERLETQFEENEVRIGQLQEALDKRLGSLRELFGVLQQVAGDTRGQFEGSLVSSQYPNRGDWLGELAKKMGTASQLATIEEMEDLWFELQREATESGKIANYPVSLTTLNGEKTEVQATRLGAFGIVADGEFLRWDPDNQVVTQLGRQPSGRFTGTIADIQQASAGDVVEIGIDPTRGSLLQLEIQKASWGERIGSPFGGIANGECYLPFCDGQGGYVGSVIIMLGIIGVLLALWKWFQLFGMSRRVNAQKNSDTADSGNPLGRVLQVYDENKDTDVETLELKLGEAILGETPKITSNITLIQVISAVAPLLGLLGTVTGMIQTFQAITLFGAGDPKTMAGGISVALMTTVLGLVVAIPTVLLHSIVNSRSKSIVHTLEEQSAGMIAEHAENSGRSLG